MNYFYSENKQKKLGKLIDHTLFSLIIEYFCEHQNEEIILRDLKQVFPQSNFTAFLDQLVDEKLVKRANRRYYLNFPIIDESKFKKEIEESTALIVKKLAPFSQEEKQLIMGEVIWQHCFELAHDYFYATAEKVLSISKHVAGNQSYQWVSLNYQAELPLSLANYFYLQQNQYALPEKFIHLAEVIGDVNEGYYFDQVEVIIERIQANKYKQRRPSIFFDSLVQTNTIEKKVVENETNIKLAIPMIAANRHMFECPKIEYGQTVEENAYIKRKVYERLIKQFALTDFSYLRKLK